MITSASNDAVGVASREVDISEALGDSVDAEPAGREGSEIAILAGVADHLIEG